MVDTSVGSVKKVLLLLVVGSDILGLSMKVSDILVKIVISYSLRRGILDTTSRASTRARNRTTVLIVDKTLHRKLTSSFTFELYTTVRSPTSVLCAVEGLVREVPLPSTSGLYTQVRNLTSALIAVKLLPVRRVCRDI